MKKLFLLLLAVLSISLCASAQTRTVKGVVVYAGDQEPLPGATILPVGGGNGVATDIDGKFSLEVPAKVTKLNVSYVGMVTKQVTITTGEMRIELTNSENNLDEVMVVAYGTAKKSTYTGSAAVVKADDINKVQTSNAVNALNGKVSGVQLNNATGQPGANDPTILIRGISSINGTQDPLWVLDGIPLEGTDIPSMEELKDIDNIYQPSIAGITPTDIDSITVLKDAAATAIYGARAANGVIVITTRNGKAGKPQINFSTKLTYSPKSDIDRLNLLNSQEKVGLELDLLQSNYTFRENKGDVARIISQYGLTDAYKNGGWNALSPEAQSDINHLRSINTDWNDILFVQGCLKKCGIFVENYRFRGRTTCKSLRILV